MNQEEILALAARRLEKTLPADWLFCLVIVPSGATAEDGGSYISSMQVDSAIPLLKATAERLERRLNSSQ